jgi:hypothetical protein
LSIGFDGMRRAHEIYLQPTVKPNGEISGISGVLTAVEDQRGEN